MMIIKSLSVCALLWAGVAFAANPTASSTNTKTNQNLETAIRAEANAANEYQLFSQKAEQEGYSQVAKLFRAAAEAESIHRGNHQIALLSMGGPAVEVKLKPVTVKSTRENLKVPIEGEAQERSVIYPRWIEQARKDHADKAVQSFIFARDTEAKHEKYFKKALAELGHNPPDEYYVSRVSGDTVAVPKGFRDARTDQSEYFRVA